MDAQYPQLAGHFITNVPFTVCASTLRSTFHWEVQNYPKVRLAGCAPSMPSWAPRGTPPTAASPPRDASPRSGSCLPPDRVLDRPLESHYSRDGLAPLPMRRWPTPPAPHEGTMSPPHTCPKGQGTRKELFPFADITFKVGWTVLRGRNVGDGSSQVRYFRQYEPDIRTSQRPQHSRGSSLHSWPFASIRRDVPPLSKRWKGTFLARNQRTYWQSSGTMMSLLMCLHGTQEIQHLVLDTYMHVCSLPARLPLLNPQFRSQTAQGHFERRSQNSMSTTATAGWPFSGDCFLQYCSIIFFTSDLCSGPLAHTQRSGADKTDGASDLAELPPHIPIFCPIFARFSDSSHWPRQV